VRVVKAQPKMTRAEKIALAKVKRHLKRMARA